MTTPTLRSAHLSELSTETQAALSPYLPKQVPAPGTEARSTLLAELSADAERAWRAAVAADEAGGFVDVPMARRIQAVLTRALVEAEALPSELVVLLVGAVRYFSEVDDGLGDHTSQWGFDDDRTVVDGVISVLNRNAGLTLKRTGNVMRKPRVASVGPAGGRKLPRVDDLTRGVLLRLRPNLGELIYDAAEHAVEAARRDGVPATVADLRVRIAAHLAVTEQARLDADVADVRAAREIAAGLEALLLDHETESTLNDRVLPLVFAAAESFIETDDEADDLTDPFGFEDDREVLAVVREVIAELRREEGAG